MIRSFHVNIHKALGALDSRAPLSLRFVSLMNLEEAHSLRAVLAFQLVKLFETTVLSRRLVSAVSKGTL
jgi:hypothetical protein